MVRLPVISLEKVIYSFTLNIAVITFSFLNDKLCTSGRITDKRMKEYFVANLFYPVIMIIILIYIYWLTMNNLNLPQVAIKEFNQSVWLDISALIDSDQLFKNGDVVFILHKGEQYSLRRTRNGKLILNK